ncbi:MAG: prepilin-type N-terminal cleavage/methylation domain-containing protein [Sedimentisphaerales bacterium]|nr:prepilin-type N-terminal cleavage/methylation domain-containing protein [Sedimentisphaerales bacterium]
MRHRRGFTLIELLVVIAIIAVLVGILLPSLSRAKKQAKMVVCQSLLKQWGTIWSMYCDDNNGYFSSGISSGGWNRGEWVISLRYQYQTKGDILKCPMATKRLPSGDYWGGPFNTYSMPEDETGFSGVAEEPSYGQNCWVYNPPSNIDIQGRPAAYHWRTKDSLGTAYIPVFADSMWRGGGPSSDKGSISCDPPSENGQWVDVNHEMKHFCIDRHSGGINIVFMDWHVEKVGLKKLWKLKWHKNFDTHNAWTQPNAPWPEWMRNLPEG